MSAADSPPATYDELPALFVNCTLKPSPETSHTQLLADRSIAIMCDQGVTRGRRPCGGP